MQICPQVKKLLFQFTRHRYCSFQGSSSVQLYIVKRSYFQFQSYVTLVVPNASALCKLSLLQQPFLQSPGHCLIWGWLNAVFNKYDDSRVKEVGPNRACAEWLLRCGASIRWSIHDAFISDYNSLPVGGPSLKLAEVDATDSAVMDIGFEHFKGCRDITRVVLHRAVYVDDSALRQLQHLRLSLTHLQVSACGNVTAEGLRSLAKLSNLQQLLLYDFPEVKDREKVTRYLMEELPHCNVVFTYASAAEQEQQERERQERDRQEADKK